MSYARLLRIAVAHSYYSDGLCGDFSVAPDGDAKRLFRNHRCVVKPRASGLDIYVETGGDGKPKIPFSPNTTLSFKLFLKNPEFSLFTDSAPLSGGGDFDIAYPQKRTDRFFAKIAIRRDFNQIGGGDVDIAFSAKPFLWVYYVITDRVGPGADFSVASQDAQATTWKQVEGTDRISQKLAWQYPGARRLRFASEQMIPCRESGLQHVQLLFGGNAIIESLPNPSWRNYFQTEMEAGGGRVDAIFHVVKYLTNTTLTKV